VSCRKCGKVFYPFEWYASVNDKVIVCPRCGAINLISNRWTNEELTKLVEKIMDVIDGNEELYNEAGDYDGSAALTAFYSEVRELILKNGKRRVEFG